MEETGYDVSIEGFLGTMSHAEAGKPKVVQFWRMRATGYPARKLMDDVTAVKWLPLQQAVDTLTRQNEKAFSWASARQRCRLPSRPRAMPPPSLQHHRFPTTAATRFSKRSGPGSGA
jgi:8-oxo-dGTP diphosphatase